MSNILDYIPKGSKHAVKRADLKCLTGLPDRVMRKQIALARREVPILNMQDGSGYFIPDEDSEEDMKMLEHYVEQEESRLKSIGWSLKSARKYKREWEDAANE